MKAPTIPGMDVVELDEVHSDLALLEHFDETAFAPTQPMGLMLSADPKLDEPGRWARVMGRVGRACS